jgi:hypothetical protein
MFMEVLHRAGSDFRKRGPTPSLFPSAMKRQKRLIQRAIAANVLFSALAVGGQVTVERTGETRENGILARNFRKTSETRLSSAAGPHDGQQPAGTRDDANSVSLCVL